jgi:hypothetical protein
MEAVFRPEIFRIFPLLSARFLPESTGSRQESTGKKRKISRWNTASMFQRFPVLFRRIR